MEGGDEADVGVGGAEGLGGVVIGGFVVFGGHLAVHGVGLLAG